PPLLPSFPTRRSSDLPSLVFVAGYLGTAGWLGDDVAVRFVYALGFGVGSFLWFAVLLRVLHGMRARLTGRVTVGVNRFAGGAFRSEEHTSELQSRGHL